MVRRRSGLMRFRLTLRNESGFYRFWKPSCHAQVMPPTSEVGAGPEASWLKLIAAALPGRVSQIALKRTGQLMAVTGGLDRDAQEELFEV